MDKNVKILVCCHKKDIAASEQPYMPIQVGKALSDIDLGIQGDDTGDNISDKNRSYCELTGMYWAWKNLKDVNVIGLCHYRRYFDFHGQCKRILDRQSFNTEDFDKINLSIPNKLINNLKDGHAIVAKKRHYMLNLYNDYCRSHISDDIRVLSHIIKETQPDYLDSFNYIMHGTNTLIHYNMFIMTWKDFDAYCSWLFEVLAEVEKRIDISHYSAFQQRIYGYMAERLFNVYLHAHKFHLDQRKVIWFGNQTNRSALGQLQYNMRGDIALLITKRRGGRYPTE